MIRKYMVVEHFTGGGRDDVYQRLAEKGRMLPDGLFFIESWLAADGKRCFQLMETADPALFTGWMKNWQDLVTFEITQLGEKPVQPKKGE